MCFGKLNIRSIFFGKEKVWPADYEIILNHYEVRVLTGASWASISVTANTNDWYVISDVNWMTASKISNTQARYEWTQNEGDERVGHLKFMIDGVEYARCEVTQVAAAPSHTYVFTMDPTTSTNVAYAGGTLVVKINSRCDGNLQELDYVVQENGQTPSWIHLLQRQVNQYDEYNYVYYFAINSNSGSVRHAGFTFTQSGSNNTLQLSITQQAYTSAFDGLDIKARINSQYGYWVIGTIDNGMGGPPPTYPNRAVVIATDQTITSPRRITYTLTASRLKSLPAPQSGTSTITKTLTQTISPGATVKPNTSSTGKTYYGTYVILTDTSFTNGEWVTTSGTHTTMSPYPSQDVSNVTISNVTIT